MLDATIVNVALPSIQRALHFTAQNLQWVASGYALTFGGFLARPYHPEKKRTT